MTRRTWTAGLAGLVLIAAAPDAGAQSQTPPTGQPSPPDSAAGEDEIVITTQRLPGSVVGDARPDIVLGPTELRSYAASNVSELLGALSPQTGSASRRGDGAPIVLVNGRRITSFQEIRDLPAEAIARVEIFNEQLAVAYGFAPDQRVVNLILRRRYQVNTAEAAALSSADGERAAADLDASRVVFDGGGRFAATLSVDNAERLTERDRGITAPITGSDDRAVRTLLPETDTIVASTTLSRPLTEQVAATGTLRLENADSSALLGRDTVSGAIVRRMVDSSSLRATGAIDGMASGWQWTTSIAATLSEQESRTRGGASERTAWSENGAVEISANTNGPVMALPAGDLRISARLGLDQRWADATSQTAFGLVDSSLDRSTAAIRLGVSAPITSRRNEVGENFGDIGINASLSLSDVSDVGELNGHGYGVSWSPISGLRVSLQREQSQSPAGLQQLGDPIVSTPNVTVFDPVRGETVEVTRVTGGAPSLRNEDRDDLTASLSWSPADVRGLTLIANWARNESDNVVVALPTLLPEAQTAFADRFVRDGSGRLIVLDARPVNLAERRQETLRIGFDFSQTFGTPAQPPAGSPPWGPGLSPWGSGPPPWGSGPPPWGSGPPPWERNRQSGQGGGAPGATPQAPSAQGGPRQGGGGFGGGGFGGGGFGGGPPPGGRWNIAVYAVQRLEDSVTLRPGGVAVDVVRAGGLTGEEGSRVSLEFEGGIVYRGLGLRMNGAWAGERTLRTGVGDLSVADRLTLNARVFVNFDQQFDLLAQAPFLSGTRLSFGVQNLTDSAPDVRDASGVTPFAYQEGFLAPQGRVVQLSLRKQF